MPRLPILLLAALAACAGPARRSPAPEGAQDTFFAALSALCGRAFEGKVALDVGGGPGPDPFEGKRLVMHVRECSSTELRVPFHVGDDHSRTWVFTRTASGLRLQHDHRHQDGTPDDVTMYGGDTTEAGTPGRQAFPADQSSRDSFVRANLPQSVSNVWVVGLGSGVFSYGLTRPSRDFRVDFDLTRPVANPPAPWGSR